MSRLEILAFLCAALLFLAPACGSGKAPNPAADSESGTSSPQANASQAQALPPKTVEGWIARLGGTDQAARDEAITHLESVRDAEYAPILDAWEKAPDGKARELLDLVLQTELLRKADLVVIGEGLRYYPRSHLAGISGECRVCAQGRLAIAVDRALKGGDRLGQAGEFFAVIGRLPGHAAHELPEVLKEIGARSLAYVLLDGGKMKMEDLKKADEEHTGRKGIWALRFREKPVTFSDMREKDKISPDFLLTWLCDGDFLPESAAERVAATLGKLG
jgi:hypothetical protein